MICRKELDRLKLRRHTASHAGLLLDRYLAEPVVGDGPDSKNKPEERRDILDAAIRAGRDPETRELYRLAYDRWLGVVGAGISKHEVLPTIGRLIVGLGGSNALETGIRLHHAYGVPVIPGSALKGLASHYCHEVWGQADQGEDEKFKENRLFRRGGEYHKLLFGAQDDGGCVAFHDAWIVPTSLDHEGLALDVMTPHHPKFQADPENSPPTDFDDPNPIAFLSVTGSFLVAVSWDGPPGVESARDWTNLAHQILKDALRNWGIGGKTSSGYGRLGVPPKPESPGQAPAPGRAASLRPTREQRKSGDPARVKILGFGKKGGFRVQEEGRPAGALNEGIPAAQPTEGDLVDVFISEDHATNPRYTWNKPHTRKPGSTGPGKKPGGRR